MPSLSENVKNSGVGLRAVNGSNPLYTDIVSEDPIHINCSGYNYFDPNVTRVRIERTKGRQDYQLLYIQEGSGEFWFNNRKQVLKKGTLCLFRPHVPQVYSYLNDETTISYFVHFSGSWIPKLLAPFGPQDQICFYIENALFFGETILKISRALQLHEYNYDLECAALFLDLITKLTRSVSLAPASGPQTTNAFAPALNVMNNQYRKTLSIDEYAELCGMSTYYFVRKFKEHTGFSPHFYLIKVRMERAKEFLLTTNMNVSEISYSVGYDNPLYFSRMFKKYTGVSPVNFRKQVTTPQLFMEDTEAE